MADSPFARKMKRRAAAHAAIINAPAGYQTKAFRGLPPAAGSLAGQFDWIQIFAQNSTELARLAPRAFKALKPDAILWISFPKGSSKIQTDLTRDKGWESVRKLDLKWLTLVSVDETWSAFALRPYRPGEARQPFR